MTTRNCDQPDSTHRRLTKGRRTSRMSYTLGAERLEGRLVMAPVVTGPWVGASIAMPITPQPIVEISPVRATFGVALGTMPEDTTLRITKAQLLASAGGIVADAVDVRNLAVSRGQGTLFSASDGTQTFTPASNWNGNVGFSYEIVAARPVEFRVINGLDQADAFTDSPNGVAVFKDGMLVLTPPVRSQGGSMFLDDRFDLTRDFSTSFRLNMSGGTGADGIAFVVHAAETGSRSLGSFGGGIGYHGITPGIAVEFDTFINVGDPGQGHHVGISTDGNSESLVSAYPQFSLRGEDIYAWVDYSSIAGTLSVFVSTAAVKPEAALMSLPIALADRVGREGWFGFTAATGARTDRQVVKEWALRAWQPRLGGPIVHAGVATLVVTPVNDPPAIAGPVNLGTMLEDGARRITPRQLLARSVDLDGDTLSVANLAIAGGMGTLTRAGDGTWWFRPAVNWNGQVQFSYLVSDGQATVGAVARLFVCPVNDAPTVSGIVNLGTIASGVPMRITSSQLLSLARDVDGDRLSVRQLRVVGGVGSLSANSDGTWTIVTSVAKLTRVTLTYEVSDGRLSTLASAVAWISTPKQPAEGTQNLYGSWIDPADNLVRVIRADGSYIEIDRRTGKQNTSGTWKKIGLNAYETRTRNGWTIRFQMLDENRIEFRNRGPDGRDYLPYSRVKATNH